MLGLRGFAGSAELEMNEEIFKIFFKFVNFF